MWLEIVKGRYDVTYMISKQHENKHLTFRKLSSKTAHVAVLTIFQDYGAMRALILIDISLCREAKKSTAVDGEAAKSVYNI